MCSSNSSQVMTPGVASGGVKPGHVHLGYAPTSLHMSSQMPANLFCTAARWCNSCLSQDMQELHHRAAVQNKLAGICEDMCKEVGAYPKCTCPGFTPPDATPGVMTWDELLEHMDNLVEWSEGQITGWHKQASQLQTKKVLPH